MCEPLTDTINDTSRDITKTLMETSIKNNEAVENLNNKLLERMNDRGIISFYFLLTLSKINNPEKASQFELVKHSNSNRVNVLLINKTIPITLCGTLLTFRDTDKKFDLQGALYK